MPFNDEFYGYDERRLKIEEKLRTRFPAFYGIL